MTFLITFWTKFRFLTIPSEGVTLCKLVKHSSHLWFVVYHAPFVPAKIHNNSTAYHILKIMLLSRYIVGISAFIFVMGSKLLQCRRNMWLRTIYWFTSQWYVSGSPQCSVFWRGLILKHHGRCLVKRGLYVICLRLLQCWRNTWLRMIYCLETSGKMENSSRGHGVLPFYIERTWFKLAVNMSNWFLPVVAHDKWTVSGIVWPVTSLIIQTLTKEVV